MLTGMLKFISKANSKARGNPESLLLCSQILHDVYRHRVMCSVPMDCHHVGYKNVLFLSRENVA